MNNQNSARKVIEKKRLDPAEKRRKIMEVATGQFLRDGYDLCTMDRVAEEARVGKQAIYQFFASKEQLFADVTRAQLIEAPLSDLPLELPVEQVIEDYLLDTINLSADTCSFGMVRINILAVHQLPALAYELNEDRRRRASDLARYLARLAQQKRIPPLACDSLDLATRLAGMATEGVRHLLGTPWPRPEERKAIAQFTTRLFLSGCPCDEEPTAGSSFESEHIRRVSRSATMRLQADKFANLCSKAEEGFLKRGFDSMSLDDLVAATGVSRATIYRQFGNKEGLFRFFLNQEIDRIAAEAWPLRDSPDLLTELRDLAEHVLADHMSARSLALYRLLIKEVDRVPDLAVAFYNAQLQRLRVALAEIYRRHKDHNPCERCVVAFHTLATFGVRFLTSSLQMDKEDIQGFSNQAAKIMVNC